MTSVLLIDDCPHSRKFFELSLKNMPINVITTEDKRKGLDLFIQRDFSCVFLDMNIEGQFDGYEIAGLMRKVKARIPLVLFSGYIFGDIDRSNLFDHVFDKATVITKLDQYVGRLLNIAPTKSIRDLRFAALQKEQIA